MYPPGVGVTRAVRVLQHIPKFSKHVDLNLKIVGYKKSKVSVFKNNPVHKRIKSAAEALNDAVGGMMGRTSTPDKHIGLDDIDDLNILEIDTPLPPLDGQENPDAIDYA